jgi:hypothetical protein
MKNKMVEKEGRRKRVEEIKAAEERRCCSEIKKKETKLQKENEN